MSKRAAGALIRFALTVVRGYGGSESFTLRAGWWSRSTSWPRAWGRGALRGRHGGRHGFRKITLCR